MGKEEIMNRIKDKSLEYYKSGTGRIKVHISKIDYPSDKPYNTSCGIFINGKLKDVYILENICNDEIDEFLYSLGELKSRNTLFLI